MLSPVSSPPTRIRPATAADLPNIVRMLADDPLGAERERFEEPLPASYLQAFEAIERDPNNELMVAVDGGDKAVVVLQLTLAPYITHQGGWRAMIEGVRVDSGWRSSGLGREILDWARERAQQRGCHVVQLTTDKQRPDARRFYEKLGFVASHEGMKLNTIPSSAGGLLRSQKARPRI